MPDALPSLRDWKALTLNIRRNLQPILLNDLDSLESDIELYGQAFSMMAKRNVASDIYVTAKGLRDRWPTVRPSEKVPDLISRLIDSAKQAVEDTGGTTKRAYDSAVCIGYEIRLASGYTLPNHQFVVTYSGDVDNRIDMMERCRRMVTAIQEAYDFYPATYPPPPATDLHPPDRTLRIFMAPEFFFRGKHGAYPASVGFEVLPILR